MEGLVDGREKHRSTEAQAQKVVARSLGLLGRPQIVISESLGTRCDERGGFTCLVRGSEAASTCEVQNRERAEPDGQPPIGFLGGITRCDWKWGRPFRQYDGPTSRRSHHPTLPTFYSVRSTEYIVLLLISTTTCLTGKHTGRTHH